MDEETEACGGYTASDRGRSLYQDLSSHEFPTAHFLTPFLPLKESGSVIRTVGEGTKREKLQGARTFLLDFIKF